MNADLPGYARAQREWEAREPDDGGPRECAGCNGKGELPDHTDPDGDYVQCEACEGFGLVTASGYPFDPVAAERAECEYADFKRNQREMEDWP